MTDSLDRIISLFLPADRQVVFEVEVLKGDGDLQSWLIAADGNEIPAYYVDVELLD